MKELKVFDGGDAVTMGAGVMTEARWKQTYTDGTLLSEHIQGGESAFQDVP